MKKLALCLALVSAGMMNSVSAESRRGGRGGDHGRDRDRSRAQHESRRGRDTDRGHSARGHRDRRPSPPSFSRGFGLVRPGFSAFGRFSPHRGPQRFGGPLFGHSRLRGFSRGGFRRGSSFGRGHSSRRSFFDSMRGRSRSQGRPSFERGRTDDRQSDASRGRGPGRPTESRRGNNDDRRVSRVWVSEGSPSRRLFSRLIDQVRLLLGERASVLQNAPLALKRQQRGS